MVAYGPWVQEPDYEVVNRDKEGPAASYNARRPVRLIRNGLPSNALRQSENIIYLADWTPVEDPFVMAVNEAAASADPVLDFLDTSPSNLATRAERLHPAGTFGETNWGSGAGVSIELHPWLVTPGLTNAGPTGWSPFYFYPEDEPATAVGIEFEGDPDGIAEARSVSIASTTVLRGVNSDATDTDGMAHELAGPFSTRIGVDSYATATSTTPFTGSTVVTVSGGDTPATTRTLDVDVDISSQVTPGLGCVVFTATETFVSPRAPDHYSLFDTSNRWEYGYYISELHTRWTLRPPRYRWIYDQVPFQQTSHRDDGLAGGAEQTWPQPKAYQASNRTAGGYL